MSHDTYTSPQPSWLAFFTRNQAILWYLTALLVVVCHIATFTRSPVLWQDEAQITDQFRVIHDLNTPWALQINPDHTPRIVILPWLQLIQKLVFNLLGVDVSSVRLISLLGALLCALGCFAVLRTWNFSIWPAAWLALLFISDPLFIQSYRGGRVDMLAVAPVLLALACWMRAWQTPSNTLPWAVLAGFLLPVGIMVWTTAVIFTLGLLIVVLLLLRPASMSHFLKMLAGAAVGAVLSLIVTLALVLIDFSWDQFVQFLHELNKFREAQTERRWSLALSLFTTPATGVLLFILTLPWMKTKAHLVWLLGLLVAITVIIVMPPFYIFRLIYLVPLCYLAVFWTVQSKSRLLALCVAILVVLNLGYGVMGRTAKTVMRWQQTDPQRIGQLLDEHIPAGSVVMGGFAYYFHGLQRGWEMYETPLPTWRADLKQKNNVYWLAWYDPLPDFLGKRWKLIHEFKNGPPCDTLANYRLYQLVSAE